MNLGHSLRAFSEPLNLPHFGFHHTVLKPLSQTLQKTPEIQTGKLRISTKDLFLLSRFFAWISFGRRNFSFEQWQPRSFSRATRPSTPTGGMLFPWPFSRMESMDAPPEQTKFQRNPESKISRPNHFSSRCDQAIWRARQLPESLRHYSRPRVLGSFHDPGQPRNADHQRRLLIWTRLTSSRKMTPRNWQLPENKRMVRNALKRLTSCASLHSLSEADQHKSAPNFLRTGPAVPTPTTGTERIMILQGRGRTRLPVISRLA